MEHNLNDLAVSHQVVVIDQVLVDIDLLEGLGVHKVCTQIVLVSELIGTTLNAYLLDLLAYRREGVLQYATIFEVLELRTNESGALTGLAVLEIDNDKGLAVHFDAHTDLNVCCCNLHRIV